MPRSTSTRPCSPSGCTSIYFGENQLSPRSIGISPLSTVHPPVLQHWWVRASTACYCGFTLTMDSSRGFGSTPSDFAPCSDSLSLRLHNLSLLYLPESVTRRFTLQ